MFLHAYRELICQAPAELLCEEVLDTTAIHDLRQLGRVAKRVRQPELQQGNVVPSEMLR